MGAKKIKIVIKTEDSKIWLPAIRFGFIEFLIRIGFKFVKRAALKKTKDKNLEFIKKIKYKDVQELINELKKYDPMVLVDIESGKDKVRIYTK